MATSTHDKRRARIAALDLAIRDVVLSNETFQPIGVVGTVPVWNVACGTVTFTMTNQHGVAVEKTWRDTRTVRIEIHRRTS